MTGEPLPPRLPATAVAWRAGDLDVEHVKVIARFLADLPIAIPAVTKNNAEAFLAEHATQLRSDQLRGSPHNWRSRWNPDGKPSDADRALRRGFTWGPQRPDGMSQGRLCASPALRAELDALFANGRARDVQPERSEPNRQQ